MQQALTHDTVTLYNFNNIQKATSHHSVTKRELILNGFTYKQNVLFPFYAGYDRLIIF